MTRIPLAIALACLASAPLPAIIRVPSARPGQYTLGRFAAMRLAFEREGARYVARGAGYQLDVSASEAVLHYSEGFGDVDNWFRPEQVRLRLVGAAGVAPAPASGEALEAVSFSGVYPDIDLECRGTPSRLEYRFAAAAGADATQIRIRIEGAGGVRVEPDGSLRARTPLGEVRIHKPVVRDPFDGEWRGVAGRFVVLRHGMVQFRTLPN